MEFLSLCKFCTSREVIREWCRVTCFLGCRLCDSGGDFSSGRMTLINSKWACNMRHFPRVKWLKEGYTSILHLSSACRGRWDKRLLPAPLIKAASGGVGSCVNTDEAAQKLKISQKERNIQVKQLKLTQNEKSRLIFIGPTQYDDRQNARITLARPDPTPPWSGREQNSIPIVQCPSFFGLLINSTSLYVLLHHYNQNKILFIDIWAFSLSLGLPSSY